MTDDRKQPPNPKYFRPLSSQDPTNDPTRCGHYGGRRKDGKPCVSPVLKGTDRCRLHAGKRTAVARAEGELRLEIQKWTLDAHDGANVSPGATLLKLIAFWEFKTNTYSRLVGEAYAAAERLQEAHAADAIVLIEEEDDEDEDGNPRYEPPDRQVARADLQRIFNLGGVAALIGHRYDVDRNGRVFAVEEGLRALTKLEGEASDRLARYCALAIQVKVSESLMGLYRQVGGQLALVLGAVLRRLGVAVDSPQVSAIVAEEIGALMTSAPRVIEGRPT